MKVSRLIAILAKHMAENGDHPVFLWHPKVDDVEVTNCWYNYGKDWGKPDRIVISSNQKG